MKSIVLSKEYAIPTKEEVAKQIDEIVMQVEDGWTNPLQAQGLLTALEQVIAGAKKRIMPMAITEAEKYGKGTFGAFNAEFQVKEAGVKYDFSADGEWQDYQETIEQIKAQQKGRETVLKAMGMCGKSSTTTLQVTLKK